MSDDLLKRHLEAYLAGTLDQDASRELGQALEREPELAREAEGMRALWDRLGLLDGDLPAVPGNALRSSFRDVLRGYRAGALRTPPVRRWPWMAAAGLLVAVCLGLAGGALALWVEQRSARAEIVALRGELEHDRVRLATALLERPSVFDRLRGVALLHEMVHLAAARERLYLLAEDDPSVNVRLAALDALYERALRGRLDRSPGALLAGQDDPFMQLAVIDLAVVAKETGSADALRRIAADEAVDPTVRDKARWGLAALGQGDL